MEKEASLYKYIPRTDSYNLGALFEGMNPETLQLLNKEYVFAQEIRLRSNLPENSQRSGIIFDSDVNKSSSQSNQIPSFTCTFTQDENEKKVKLKVDTSGDGEMDTEIGYRTRTIIDVITSNNGQNGRNCEISETTLTCEGVLNVQRVVDELDTLTSLTPSEVNFNIETSCTGSLNFDDTTQSTDESPPELPATQEKLPIDGEESLSELPQIKQPTETPQIVPSREVTEMVPNETVGKIRRELDAHNLTYVEVCVGTGIFVFGAIFSLMALRFAKSNIDYLNEIQNDTKVLRDHQREQLEHAAPSTQRKGVYVIAAKDSDVVNLLQGKLKDGTVSSMAIGANEIRIKTKNRGDASKIAREISQLLKNKQSKQ